MLHRRLLRWQAPPHNPLPALSPSSTPVVNLLYLQEDLMVLQTTILELLRARKPGATC
jgi:hypothetical protein